MMSEQISPLAKTIMTGALAAFAVAGSYLVYSRLSNIEQKVNSKTKQLDDLIAQIEMKTKDVRSGSSGKGGGSSPFEEKISSI